MDVIVLIAAVVLIAIVFWRWPGTRVEESFVGPKWYKRKNLTVVWK